MSLADERESPRIKGFPRVSGDEPVTANGLRGFLWFSPRERG